MASAGTDSGISTQNNNATLLVAKAQFAESCCMVGPRTYLHVLENGVESNRPFYCCCYPNFFCIDFDRIWKSYFDRGLWDQRSCAYYLGIHKGPPTFYSHNPKHVCLCVDCCDCYNDCAACHNPDCCGDRLYYTPFDYTCCCCSTRATPCTNWFGLCGPKTGEPICIFNFVQGILPGTGENLSASINNARASWSARTMKP